MANSWRWHLNWLAVTTTPTTSTVCTGQTLPGNTNWQVYTSTGLYLDVDTSACSYSTTPLYLTALGGTAAQWYATGATAIYQPTATGFRIYIRAADDAPLTPALVNSWGWHLTWTAVANNVTLVRKYYDADNQRVALRENGALRWLLGDHLGSTAITVYDTTKVGELRYRPWGGTRYSGGQTITGHKFTGQREEAGIGQPRVETPRLTSKVGSSPTELLCASLALADFG